MNSLIYSLLATLLISLVSFTGALAILLKKDILNKILLWLVGFSAGTLIGGAFLHLIPEALIGFGTDKIFIYVLVGFGIFFVLEKFLLWHHCHKHDHGEHKECQTKTFGYMNLVGDGFHNLIDGMVIAAAFSVDVNLGVATTFAVLAHEVPQEISDFGVLIYSGFSRAKALIFNFVSALISVLGAIIGYFIVSSIDSVSAPLIAITAGGFIYISASDLIPELHKENNIKNSSASLLFFLAGIFFMYFMKMLFE